MANTPTHEWNGKSGETWRDNQERLDRMLAPYGEAAIAAAALASGERVLDIGCGAGATSLALAARVGAGGYVLGLDISEPLIARAQERLPPGAPLAFELGDASSAQLPTAAFDLLFSRFGVMFFDDSAAAFTHMRRALKPSGRLAFVCWRPAKENEWVSLPMRAASGLFEVSAPDPNAPGPFAFADTARVRGILSEAGFADVEIRPFDTAAVYGEGQTQDAAIDSATALLLQVGPLGRALQTESEETKARAASALRTLLAQRGGDGAIKLGGAAWIVTARNN